MAPRSGGRSDRIEARGGRRRGGGGRRRVAKESYTLCQSNRHRRGPETLQSRGPQEWYGFHHGQCTHSPSTSCWDSTPALPSQCRGHATQCDPRGGEKWACDTHSCTHLPRGPGGKGGRPIKHHQVLPSAGVISSHPCHNPLAQSGGGPSCPTLATLTYHHPSLTQTFGSSSNSPLGCPTHPPNTLVSKQPRKLTRGLLCPFRGTPLLGARGGSSSRGGGGCRRIHGALDMTQCQPLHLPPSLLHLCEGSGGEDGRGGYHCP